MHGVIFFKEICEMCFECRLRGMRSGDLNPLPKRLQTLLLPKYCETRRYAPRSQQKVNSLLNGGHTWYASSDLHVAEIGVIGVKDGLCLET